MSVPEENVVRDRPARTARDLEVCECGDYRWQHVSGVGRCVFDTHGGIEPCLVFRLSSAAIRPVGPRPDGSFKWLAFPCQARLEDGSLKHPDRECRVPIHALAVAGKSEHWTFTGDTLSPSINCESCGWHGHILNGEIAP